MINLAFDRPDGPDVVIYDAVPSGRIEVPAGATHVTVWLGTRPADWLPMGAAVIEVRATKGDGDEIVLEGVEAQRAIEALEAEREARREIGHVAASPTFYEALSPKARALVDAIMEDE